MDEKKIREQFAPRECESQIEFERIMEEMNNVQSHLNRPLLDQLRGLLDKTAKLKAERAAITVQLEVVKSQRLAIEQQQKEINRVFHDLKYELIVMNPR